MTTNEWKIIIKLCLSGLSCEPFCRWALLRVWARALSKQKPFQCQINQTNDETKKTLKITIECFILCLIIFCKNFLFSHFVTETLRFVYVHFFRNLSASEDSLKSKDNDGEWFCRDFHVLNFFREISTQIFYSHEHICLVKRSILGKLGLLTN